MPFNTIFVVFKPHLAEEFDDILITLIPWLLKRKKKLMFLEKERLKLKKLIPKSFKSFHFSTEQLALEKSDLVITLGGDGTFIGICRKFSTNAPPVFGINLGHLGFITEFSSDKFLSYLDSTLRGVYETTNLTLHKVEIFRKNKMVFKSYFLNDVVVRNGQISRMLKLAVEADDEHIYNLSGDGLIISSPIGSTAYSMAAGGPILHPTVKAITLTPVCAHSLTHRPLVVPGDSVIKVTTQKGNESVCVTLDGQEVVTAQPEDKIIVTRSKTRIVQIVKNNNRTYFSTLKEKFTLGTKDTK
jgi:NAD+ kinase